MAIHTLVIETYVIPLPKVRAQAMLSEADKLAAKSNRNEQENMKLHNLIEASLQQIQLAETLGYGTRTATSRSTHNWMRSRGRPKPGSLQEICSTESTIR
jgi:hypothetical protein